MTTFKTLIFFLAILGFPMCTLAQTNGNGQGKPWVVLTSQYNTSPFNTTTDVDVYFDGSDYSANVTSIQFRIGYDGTAFTSVNTVVNLLGSSYVINFNDDIDANTVLVSVVYTGSSSTQTIPDGAFVTIKFNNTPAALLYNQEQNRSAFNFSGFTAIGSNSLGNDITLSTLNHGGTIKIPHRRYFGFVQDYHTNTGIPNLEYQLIKNAGPGVTGTVQTVLSGQTPTKTNIHGYYELVYYEHFYGYFVDGTTQFSFLFKTEELSGTTSSNPPALSTTDSHLQLLYATNKQIYTPIQLLASDVNQSHTSTLADAYSSFARFSNRFANWQTLGPGGYRDVMIIDPKDKKFLEYEVLTQTQLGTGPLGFKPKMTNWTYVLQNYVDYSGPNSHAGQHQFQKDFFAVIMGDVNGTGLGGQPKPGTNKIVTSTTQDTTDTIFVTIPDLSGAVGEYSSVEVKMNTRGVNISSFGLQLNYNSEVLEFIQAQTYGIPSSWMLFFNADSVNVIDFGGMDGSGKNFPLKTNQDQSVLGLKFKIKNSTVIEVPLTFGSAKTAGDVNGKDVVVSTKDAVINTNGVPTPITQPVQLPSQIQLSNNYPNPFNPSTVITVAIPSGGESVSLIVYDSLGREVETIFRGRLVEGNHSFVFSSNTLPSGVYIYKLVGDTNIITKKMILLK
jgi:hypothetical protein